MPTIDVARLLAGHALNSTSFALSLQKLFNFALPCVRLVLAVLIWTNTGQLVLETVSASAGQASNAWYCLLGEGCYIYCRMAISSIPLQSLFVLLSECREWSAAPISDCWRRGARGYFCSECCVGGESVTAPLFDLPIDAEFRPESTVCPTGNRSRPFWWRVLNQLYHLVGGIAMFNQNVLLGQKLCYPLDGGAHCQPGSILCHQQTKI